MLKRIRWIAIYSLDSVIRPLTHWANCLCNRHFRKVCSGLQNVYITLQRFGMLWNVNSVHFVCAVGTLLRVCPITEKGRILVLCFLTSNEGLTTTQGNDLSPSSASSCANLIVSCDDGTFCLLQCGVALSHSAKPLEDRYVHKILFSNTFLRNAFYFQNYLNSHCVGHE